MNTSHTDLNTAISAFLHQQDLPCPQDSASNDHQVLKLIYPTVASLLGETHMASLNQVYDRYYPAEYQQTNRYGEHFPDLLALQHRTPHDQDTPDWLAMAALASIEYHLCSLYYADSLPLSQLKAARLEDASAPVTVDFSRLSDAMIERLERHHPLMNSVAYELRSSPCWLMRRNFRFVAVAHPDDTEDNAIRLC